MLKWFKSLFRSPPSAQSRDLARQRARIDALHAISSRVDALDLPANEKAAAGEIFRYGIKLYVADVLIGMGSLSGQGYVGIYVPDPNDPHPDDDQGVEFYWGDYPSTYMGAEAFVAYLHMIHGIVPEDIRAPQSDMGQLREALAKVGVT